MARLIIAPSFRAVLVDARRIGAALAFIAGIVTTIGVVARRVTAIGVVTLAIIALAIIALVVKTLPITALPVTTLPVLRAVLLAAVIVVARWALVLTAILNTVLAWFARAGFGGFNQACFVIADHFDHIVA